MTFDARLTPARPDLAAAHLRGQVEAARYVEGTPAHVVAEVLDMRGVPEATADLTSQLLWGEPVTVYDRQSGFAWVQSGVDDYVGWVPEAGLASGAVAPGAMVTTQAAQLYAAPKLKLPPLVNLPHGARLDVSGEAGGYLRVGDLWCPAQQVTAQTELSGDFVAVAERYVGAPYLWGGRSARGLDCSALVQLSLAAVGRAAPRDSDMQRALGREVAVADRRGDLVCWKGHIGIMVDEARFLHANAHHMTTVIEPLAEAVARIAATDTGPVLTIRRL